MATIFRGGEPVGRIRNGIAVAGRPLLDSIGPEQKENNIQENSEYEPIFTGGRSLRGSGTPLGGGDDSIGTPQQQSDLQERRDRMESGLQERRERMATGMDNTRSAIQGDTSLMGQRNASPNAMIADRPLTDQEIGGSILNNTLNRVSRLVNRLTAIQPRTVSPSLANLGFGLERQFGGQRAIDRQLNDRGLSLSQPVATTAGIMDDMAENLDLPEDEVFDLNLGDDYDAPDFVADFDMGDSEDTLDSAFTIA